MRILGIDPGFGRLGYGVIEIGTHHAHTVLTYGCFETEKTMRREERLHLISQKIKALCDEFQPSRLAIEELFFSKNQKTAMRVAEVRGALISCAGQNGIEVFEYSPGQIKNAAAGWGGADKKQVAAMLHVLMKIDKKIQHDDEYDAIAIGLTHLVYARS